MGVEKTYVTIFQSQLTYGNFTHTLTTKSTIRSQNIPLEFLIENLQTNS